MYYKKVTHREELVPVFRLLAERARQVRLKDVAQTAGLTDWQTGRLLASAISSPSFIDMVRLLKALDVTPNDAADLAGIGTSESLYARRARAALSDDRLTDEQRDLLCHDLEVLARVFTDANSRMAEHEAARAFERLDQRAIVAG